MTVTSDESAMLDADRMSGMRHVAARQIAAARQMVRKRIKSLLSPRSVAAMNAQPTPIPICGACFFPAQHHHSGQVLVIAAAVLMFNTPLPLGAMGAIIVLQTAANGRTWMRLRKAAPVKKRNCSSSCSRCRSTDRALYLIGAHQPLCVSVPVAAHHRRDCADARYAWAMAGLTSLLFGADVFYLPLGHGHEMVFERIQPARAGNVANFLVSAVLIASSSHHVGVHPGRDANSPSRGRGRCAMSRLVALARFAAGRGARTGHAALDHSRAHKGTGAPLRRRPGPAARTCNCTHTVDNCKRIITRPDHRGRAGASGQAKRQSVEESWPAWRKSGP